MRLLELLTPPIPDMMSRINPTQAQAAQINVSPTEAPGDPYRSSTIRICSAIPPAPVSIIRMLKTVKMTLLAVPIKSLFKKNVKSIIVNEIYSVKIWITAWIFLNMPIRTE